MSHSMRGCHCERCEQKRTRNSASQKRYYARNQKRIDARRREYRVRWSAANRDGVAERGRLYRAANREKVAEQHRLYREANREKVAEYQRKYRARKKAEKAGVDHAQSD